MTFDPCRPVREHLSDELDGQELPLHIQAMVSMHLTICPPCRRVNRSLIAVKEALHALRDVDVPVSIQPPGDDGGDPKPPVRADPPPPEK